MRLTDAEVHAVLDACCEVEAGELDEIMWPEAHANALHSALDKLRAEHSARKMKKGVQELKRIRRAQ